MKATALSLVFATAILGASAAAQAPDPPLAQIHAIYIEPMGGGFQTYLTAELMKRLPKGVTITTVKENADAILEGTDKSDKGGIGGAFSQALGTGGGASGAMELLSKDGAIIWADDKSDHTIPVFGTFREHGQTKVAARIAKDLAAAISKAESEEKKLEKKRDRDQGEPRPTTPDAGRPISSTRNRNHATHLNRQKISPRQPFYH